jgi:hypothetical protein
LHRCTAQFHNLLDDQQQVPPACTLI